MSFKQAPRLPPNLDLLDGSVPVKRHSADPQRSLQAKQKKSSLSMNESKSNDIKGLFDKLKSMVPYSLGVKLFIGGIIGVLSGNKAFSMLILYSIFWYCIDNEVRIPAEEIEILKPTVDLFSIGFTLLTGLTLLCLIFFVKNFGNFLNRYKKLKNNRGVKMMERFYVPFIILFVVAILITMAIIRPQTKSPYWLIIILLFLYLGMLSIFANRNKNIISWFGIFLFGTLLFNSVILFSDKNNIRKFLLSTKYGGDFPIEIERICNDTPNCNRIVKGNLFFRTEKNIILKPLDEEYYYEIPIAKIITIKYK